MVFNFSHFPDLWQRFFVKIHLLENFLGIFGFTGMIFKKNFPDLWVYFPQTSPDLWVVVLRFEWHYPVSSKLK